MCVHAHAHVYICVYMCSCYNFTWAIGRPIRRCKCLYSDAHQHACMHIHAYMIVCWRFRIFTQQTSARTHARAHTDKHMNTYNPHTPTKTYKHTHTHTHTHTYYHEREENTCSRDITQKKVCIIPHATCCKKCDWIQELIMGRTRHKKKHDRHLKQESWSSAILQHPSLVNEFFQNLHPCHVLAYLDATIPSINLNLWSIAPMFWDLPRILMMILTLSGLMSLEGGC